LQNLGDSVASHEQAVAHSPGNGQSGQSSHDIVYVKMSNAYATRTLTSEDTFFISVTLRDWERKKLRPLTSPTPNTQFSIFHTRGRAKLISKAEINFEISCLLTQDANSILDADVES
jgi:hypothetical protein